MRNVGFVPGVIYAVDFLAVSVTRLLANLASLRTHRSALFLSSFSVVNLENPANLFSPLSFLLAESSVVVPRYSI